MPEMDEQARLAVDRALQSPDSNLMYVHIGESICYELAALREQLMSITEDLKKIADEMRRIPS